MTMDLMWRIDARMRRYAWWRKWRGLPEPMPSSAVLEMIAREAIKLLHEKSTFLSTIDRPMPTGDTIRISLPQQYVKRS
jgi:hypothetical protein